ncbi:putative tellurium resistance membrane protein TerC [Pseudomonas sp. TE21394]
MEWLTSPEIWVAFFTLTALEIVLGIDNIIMISILVSRMPKHMQPRTRIFGLALAMVTRIMLLLSITWVMRLTADLFEVFGQGISGRDLILFFGGLFLLWKSSQEIYHGLEGEDEDAEEPKGAGGKFFYTIIQIAIIDIVFSLDSVITAVGMVSHVPVMIAAIVVAVLVMMLCAGTISEFIDKHPLLENARTVVPDRGRYRADRRIFRRARAEGLRLLRHGILAGGGSHQHSHAHRTGPQGRQSA